MKYLSTRGEASSLDFSDIVLKGQAPDGGLFLPEGYPDIQPSGGASFLDFAEEAMKPFMNGLDVREILQSAWGSFPSDPAPLRQLDENLYLLELFHGPTFSFKDFGLHFLGALFEKLSEKPINVIGATSGDTGAAAVHALRGKKNVRLFMLHPKGRISEIQRRQMTTAQDTNIFNLAIEGNFDDCQRLMKGVLASDLEQHFTTINSINWGRILAQTSYYWWASTALKEKGSTHFVVPTGNFGNVFSGYVARRCGAPISGFSIATNKNDILSRTLKTGVYEPQKSWATLSPAMDIQAANNFERLLFEMLGRDPKANRELSENLIKSGSYKIPERVLAEIKSVFSADAADDRETTKAMEEVYKDYGVLIDPHTAVGFTVYKKIKPEGPVVLLATAHPGKFSENLPHANLKALDLPAVLASLMEAEERYKTLPPDLGSLQNFITEQIL